MAVAVSEDLDFHVLGVLDEPLQEHGAVPEGCFRLGGCQLPGLGQFRGFSTSFMPRPPPPWAALMSTG